MTTESLNMSGTFWKEFWLFTFTDMTLM